MCHPAGTLGQHGELGAGVAQYSMWAGTGAGICPDDVGWCMSGMSSTARGTVRGALYQTAGDVLIRFVTPGEHTRPLVVADCRPVTPSPVGSSPVHHPLNL